jgi:NTE family protein
MNLPGIFKPVLYRHRYLVDGGVVDYIPVDAAKLLGADWTLASVTEGDYSNDSPTNVLGALEQVIDIRGAILSRQQRRDADYLIEPDVSRVVYYDVSKAVQVMERGMIAASAGIEGAKESLILRSMPGLWNRWETETP